MIDVQDEKIRLATTDERRVNLYTARKRRGVISGPPRSLNIIILIRECLTIVPRAF